VGAWASSAARGENYGPNGNNELTDTSIYDGVSWKSGAAMPTGRLELAATTGPDGQVYAIGGVRYGAFLSTVEVYSPTINSWSSGVSLPQPLCCTGAAALPWGIYVVGGATSGVTSQVLYLPFGQPTGSPTPTPTGPPTSTPTPTGVTATATPTGTPPPTATATATPFATAVVTFLPAVSPTPTRVSATPTVTPSVLPTPSPTATPLPTSLVTATPFPTAIPTAG